MNVPTPHVNQTPPKKSDTFCEKTTTADCLSCGDGRVQGVLLDTENSVVIFPEGIAYEDTYETQASVCMGRQINNIFKKYKDTVAFASVGFYTGVYRSYPGKPQSVCGTYDPRIRPWYVAAAAGPKDVMLVLDVSGSMRDYERLSLAVEAAKSVIATLTFADYFGVTIFDTTAEYLTISGQGQHLYSGTQANKDAMFDRLDGLTPRSTTNFQAGFEKAFQTMSSLEYTSRCHTIMLFLTDGAPTAGEQNGDLLVNGINVLQDQFEQTGRKRANIFTFSLGFGADHSIPKAIACANDGVWTSIQDQSQDLKSSMTGYYQFMSLGLDAVDTVRFVEPYEFKFTGIFGTSASLAVFDRVTEPPKLWGVVAAGLPVADMQRIEPDYESLLNSLLFSSARCPNITITDEQLEQIRYESGGNEAVCVGVPGDIIELRPLACNNEIYPPWSQMVCNEDGKHRDFPDRGCCEPECSGSLLGRKSFVMGSWVATCLMLLLRLV